MSGGELSLLSGRFDGYPRDAALPALVAARAARSPEAPALLARPGAWTYGALVSRAGRLARALRARGVAPGDRVGLALPRSPEAVAAMLGILAAGASYVPIDPGLPPTRTSPILEAAAPRLVLTGDGEPVPGAPSLALVPALFEEGEPLALEEAPSGEAYVLFTSGTTGAPKGVAAPQRGVVRLALGGSPLRLGAGETLLLHSPLSFDASTFEIWGALLTGARLAILPPGPPSLAAIAGAVRELGVTTLWLTAGLFHLFVDERPEAFAPLAQVVAGGDVLSAAHVARLRKLHPRLSVVNGYGPTETTTFAALHEVAGAEGDALPLGLPLAGTRIVVADEGGRAVPRGVPGEILIGGDGLASGYLGNERLTAERFVADPDRPGERLYRSGDRGVVGPDGLLRFLGRLDRQVKIRGHRVEPEGVEAALLAHPAVRAAAVLAEETPLGKRLVAHVALAGEVDDEALRAHLLARLPEPSVPSLFRRGAEAPLTPEGKPDRAALAADAGLEARIGRVVAEALGLPAVDPEASLFELGADSLTLVAVHERLSQKLQTAVFVTDLFAHPTVRALACSLNRRGRESSPVPDAIRRGRLRKEAMSRERARRRAR